MIDFNNYPELKEEIDLANNNIKNYIYSDEYKNTFNLIFKVNKINDENIKNLIETETLLQILNISNYNDINLALKGEGILDSEESINQISKDIEEYIYKRVNKNIKYIPKTNIREDIEKEKNKDEPLKGYLSKIKNTNNQNTSNTKDQIIPFIGLNEDNSELSVNFSSHKTQTNLNTNNNIKTSNKNINKELSVDVYREIPEEEDKIIKTDSVL